MRQEQDPPKLKPRSTANLARSVSLQQASYNEAQRDDSWSFISMAGSLVRNATTTAGLWSDTSSNGSSNLHALALQNVDYSSNEAITTSRLLAVLEQENESLVSNPKTVMSVSGSLMGNIAALSLQRDDESVLDFWTSFLEQEPTAQIVKFHHLFLAKVRACPIPPDLRARVWRALSNARVDRMKQIYSTLLAEDSKFHILIQRDIPRTFPQVELFQDPNGQGQKELFDILKAYSCYDHEVGYCQGLSFCVGPLLMHKMRPIEAFAVLVRLMEDNPSLNSTPGCLTTDLGVCLRQI
jgi:Rab-GTPase-TBC domain